MKLPRSIRSAALCCLPLLLLPGLLSAQQRQEEPAPVPQEHLITPAKAWQLTRTTDGLFLALVHYENYREEHPLGFRQFSPAATEDIGREFPDTDRKLVLTWRYNRDEAAAFYHDLREKGYTDVAMMEGGISRWAEEDLPMEYGDRVTHDGSQYRVEGRTILREAEEGWDTLATFVTPVFSLLDRYKTMAAEAIGMGSRMRSDLYDATMGLEQNLVTPVVNGDKIWMGISYYDGEGYRGYGGLAFFDLRKEQFGVLRHPALINCSVEDLFFREKYIHIKTRRRNELSTSLCSGVLSLDRESVSTSSLVPPVEQTMLRHKDMGMLPAMRYYDKSAEEIVADERFVENEFYPMWTRERLESIRRTGLEPFMLAEYRREAEARQRAIDRAEITVDSTFVVDLSEGDQIIRSDWRDPGIRVGPDDLQSWPVRLHDQSGIDLFPFGEDGLYLYPSADYYRQQFQHRKEFRELSQGLQVIYNSDLYHYSVTVEDFTLGTYSNEEEGELPLVEEVTLQVKIGQLKH